MLHVGNALHQSSLLCSHPARLCLGWLVPGEDEGRSAAVLEFGGHRRVTLCVADVFKRHEELDGADSGLPQCPGDGSSGGAGGTRRALSLRLCSAMAAAVGAAVGRSPLLGKGVNTLCFEMMSRDSVRDVSPLPVM